MLNTEIVLKESHFNDLIVSIQDILVNLKRAGKEEISMEEFRSKLAKSFMVVSIDEIVDAVTKTEMASQVTPTSITIKPNMPADMKGEEEPGTDVGAMAQDQATADINAELPA